MDPLTNNIINNNNNTLNNSQLTQHYGQSIIASPSSSSFKEMKKSYNLKKLYFTRNVQSAIESTQEAHSGWLKARTTFKRWTKVWCQVKPGYLILYTSQEAHKKHRLGVVLLPVCQVITRPTKKDGFCFKLINPLGCSVWAKSSTRALIFSQSSLTLRLADVTLGKVWLDALHKCNLSSNLEGYEPALWDENDNDCSYQDNRNVRGTMSRPNSRCNDRSGNVSDSDDWDQECGQLESCLADNTSASGITVSSIDRNRNTRLAASCKPLANGGGGAGGGACASINYNNDTLNLARPAIEKTGDKNFENFHDSKTTQIINPNPSSSHTKTGDAINRAESSYINHNNNNNYTTSLHNHAATYSQNKNTDTVAASGSNMNISKMVAKFSKYNWKELQLEKVEYVSDEAEELGSAGIQSEEVHDSNKNFLWHILKQLRPGMDLSKVTLPTFILEPRSFLEKLADYYYHCDILSEAVLIDDPAMRLINIVKWYLSGFYKKPKGPKKPYNPILGERFRCFWDHPKTQSRTFFVAEQVSHHPPISAFHVSNRKDGFTITCALLSRSKFGGNSVSAILDGKARLHLTNRNETYTLTMPHANCRGILLGSLCLELGGKVEIECVETSCKCELDFKLASMFSNASAYNSLTGKILRANKVTHMLDGYWDKKINIVDKRTKQESVLWEVTESVRNSRLKRHTVSLRDQHARESVKLWSKVTEALVANDQVTATAEKTILEDMQRQEARERLGTFEPAHFVAQPDSSPHDWSYKWLDNRPWNPRRDIVQFEEDFKIRTLMLEHDASPTSLNPLIDLPLTQMNKLADKVQISSESVGLSNTKTSTRQLATDQSDLDKLKTIELRITAESLLLGEALKQVNEKNRKLEEDVAVLKRAKGKRTMALFMTAIIIAMLSAFFRYFA